MSSILDKIFNAAISRRNFIKASAVATASLSLTGCSSTLKKVEDASVLTEEDGKWVAAACWHNCGGRCLNKVLVKDGVVIRQKTDDTHPDSPDFPQQRGCARGRSQRHQVFGPDRLKYPMKRKHWEPGGGNKELRGRDEWVRISWDEALDLVASEIKRIKGKYGNKAILGNQENCRLLSSYGGLLLPWGSISEGAWPQVSTQMTGGTIGGLSGATSDRFDWRNARLLVLWGANPAWSSAGNPAYNLMQIKKRGTKIISVDPLYNATAQTMADDFVPVRPGTDAALLLGMAYYMITNNLHDQDFLDKYCVGFDADHMPEGADPKENFKDYVLGTFDGVPKTPEWASKICGTPPEKIRSFAYEIATTKPMIFSCSYAPARTFRGQQFCQAFLTVGWMTGNLGISGGGVWCSAHSRQIGGTKPMVKAGGDGLPAFVNPLFPKAGPYGGYAFAFPSDTDWYGPAYAEAWDAILNEEYTAGVRGKIPCNIQMIWGVREGSGGNILNQFSGTNKGIKAFRKVEFVVTNDIVLSTFSKYADIVLPATTMWEKEGHIDQGNNEAIFYYSQVTEPLYEAKDEQWMKRELAKRLGLDPDKIYPLSRKQQLFNKIAGAEVIKPDGSGYEKLVTITRQDIHEWGVKGEPQTGRITLKEFKEKGVYQVPRSEGDKLVYVAMKEFRDDPEANPLKTSSGKLEIHCQALSDIIKDYGFTTIAPIPKYEPPEEGYEETFKDWENGVKGEYPFQLFTIHYPRRSHSVFDNIPQLREAFPQEFIMNPRDADELGIKHGDIVKITSRHGSVIRPVHLSESMMPGVVTLGQGAWAEIDEETGVCKAGATNVLNGNHLSGQGEETWNTCNVKVEKWAGKPLEPDYKWPQRIIF